MIHQPPQEDAKNAAQRFSEFKIKEGFEKKALHIYTDGEGDVLYWRIRLKHPATGEKWIRPLSFNGKEFVLEEPMFPGGKPVYQLKELLDRAQEHVWIVEGEWCADHLAKKGLLVTTSGSADSAEKTDWKPLSGRTIIIWPDNDAAGERYAQKVTEILLLLGCKISIIDVSALNLPQKGDADDWLTLHPDATRKEIEDLPRNTVVVPKDQVVVEDWPDPEPIFNSDEDLSTFPCESLPPLISRAVLEYQNYGQQPLSLVAAACLGTVSLACQGLANVARDSKLVGPISLYILVIAESGERKTAADSEFSRSAREWQQQKRLEMAPKIKENRAERDAYEAERTGLLNEIKLKAKNTVDSPLKNRLCELEKQAPRRLVEPNLFYEDATPAALGMGLSQGHPSASLWSDEGGLFVGSHAMSESSLSTLSMINRLWDGNDFEIHRKQAESFRISGIRFTVELMMQRSVLQQLTSSGMSRGSGFLARFLVTSPDSTMGRRLYQDPSDQNSNLRSFHARITELLNIELIRDSHGCLQPPVLHLSDDAKTAWIDYHNRIERELASLGEFADIKDFASKSAENAARLAACFHVFELGPQGIISGKTMSQGIVIAAWFLGEARRLMLSVERPQELDDAELLLKWIVSKNISPLQNSDILQLGPYRLRTQKRRDGAIEILAKKGFLRVLQKGIKQELEMNPKFYQEVS